MTNPEKNGLRRVDLAVLAGLFVFLLIFLARSWLAWGHLLSDHGREMYVPWRLSQGDLLYADIRYPYGPLAPYWHALLYGIWGAHLSVLYASGILVTALCIAALYRIGRAIASPLAAGLGTALAMADLMLRPAVPEFSFLFPYAYPTLFGLFFVLVALCAGLQFMASPKPVPAMFGGIATGLALLTKHEFGFLALGVTGLTVAAALLLHNRRDIAKPLALLVGTSLVIPTAAFGTLCVFVDPSVIVGRGLFASDYFGWPITWSIAGIPLGATWFEALRHLGLLYTRALPSLGFAVSLVVCAAWAGILCGRSSSASAHRSWIGLLAALALLGLLGFFFYEKFPVLLRLRYAYFPALLLCWLLLDSVSLLRNRLRTGRFDLAQLQRWTVIALAMVMLARVPGNVVPGTYANFYLAPALLVLALFLVDLLPRLTARWGGSPTAARQGAAALLILLAGSQALARWDAWGHRNVALTTARGTMRLAASDIIVPMYREALETISQHTSPGDFILALPTETSLYFLSKRENPSYETSLVALRLDEEAQRHYIAEIAANPPALILTSSRHLAEYGQGYFGWDYGLDIADWIRQGYEPSPELLGDSILQIAAWHPRSKEPERTTTEIVYARGEGQPLRLDIVRRPESVGPLAVLLFFHGGGWESGSKRDVFLDPSMHWAHQGERSWPDFSSYLDDGIAIVSAEYRLSDVALAPAAVEDARAALAWIREEGPEYGLDPNRVVIAGASAGGHLALMTALAGPSAEVVPGSAARPEDRANHEAEVRGVISLYGPTDLTELLSGPQARGWVRRWVGEGPGSLERARAMSPLGHVRRGAPPTLLFHSRADRVVPYAQAQALQDALVANGVASELVTFPSATHGFLSPQRKLQVERKIRSFLARVGATNAPGASQGRAVSPKGWDAHTTTEE